MAEYDFDFRFNLGNADEEKNERLNWLFKQQVAVDRVLTEILQHSFERLPESLVLFHNSLADELHGKGRALGEITVTETVTKSAAAPLPARDVPVIDEPAKLITAIRRCASSMPGDTCEGCPYSDKEGNACQDSMLLDAARLLEKLGA